MTKTATVASAAGLFSGGAKPEVYDTDVLAALKAASLEVGLGAPTDTAEVPSIPCPDGHIPFSEAFGWKPTSIPDVPIRLFDVSEWEPSITPYIPAMPDHWVWPKQETEQFALAMYCGDRTLLYGPTGTGKSALSKAWCSRFTIPWMRINCNKFDDSTVFLGSTQLKVDKDTGANITGYEHTIVTLCAKHGGMLVIDEAFRSGALMSIQSLLEQPGTLTLPDAPGLSAGERKLSPPDGKFWLVLTDNTNGMGDSSGSYVAEVQDLSSLDRITATIYVDYPAKSDEEDVLKAVEPKADPTWIPTIVNVADALRGAFKNGKIQMPLSIRATMAWIKKAHLVGSLRRGLVLTYGAKLSKDDMAVLAEVWHQITASDLFKE